MNSISWSTGISVFNDDYEFDIPEHWSIPKPLRDEGQILTQELECDDIIPVLIAENSYSQNLIPSSTDEVGQRRPTLGEFNSTRKRAETVNNVCSTKYHGRESSVR